MVTSIIRVIFGRVKKTYINVQCKLCNVKTCAQNKMINHVRIKHKEKTAKTDEIIISTFASSVGMCRCAATRAEKISQLIMEMLNGDMFSSVEGESSAS